MALRYPRDFRAGATGGTKSTSVEAMELRDSSHGAFLLSMRNITVCKETQKEKGVHMWAVQVGEDNSPTTFG